MEKINVIWKSVGPEKNTYEELEEECTWKHTGLSLYAK